MTGPIVILGAARTPIGAFQGNLAALSAPQLGAVAIRAAVERAGIASDQVDEVLMGCVLQAGLGQAPARQAALGAGLPLATGCTTVNKVCGSGMKAIMQGRDALLSGSANLIVAGGMESMSRAPLLLPRPRRDAAADQGAWLDHLYFDGLEDAYEPGRLMGSFAEDCAARYGIGRAEQDAYAAESLARARRAQADGSFDWEMAPVALADGTEVKRDERPARVDPEKIRRLKPVFRENGSVTAANSSSLSDGAAALVLTRADIARKLGLKPLARIVDAASHAREPGWFSIAPVDAVRLLLQRTGWNGADLYEINEAFAVGTLACLRDLGLDHARVNVHGGACALGHPIGASGARIVVTLLGALRERQASRGIATLCIGGGEATALAVEII